MEISTEIENGTLIAKAEGRIDGANANAFVEAMQAASGESEGAVVIDCENLSYISSAGLRAVLLIAKTLGERDVKLVLCALSDPVTEVFEISGFGKIMAIYPTRVEALASFKG